ncbi:MAG TPA: MgtC/SapB family protein, partial [Tepidisphaeraceae bacterium]
MGFVETLDTAITAKAAALGWQTEALVRMMLAAFCGGLIGVEREMRGRQAGFRTNLLVCLGSSLVMIVSISLATKNWPSPLSSGVNINVDPGRIPYGVMGG